MPDIEDRTMNNEEHVPKELHADNPSNFTETVEHFVDTTSSIPEILNALSSYRSKLVEEFQYEDYSQIFAHNKDVIMQIDSVALKLAKSVVP